MSVKFVNSSASEFVGVCESLNKFIYIQQQINTFFFLSGCVNSSICNLIKKFDKNASHIIDYYQLVTSVLL